MIYYHCLKRNRQPIIYYLRAIWPEVAGAKIVPVYYDDAQRAFRPRPGLHVFSDIELLTPELRGRAIGRHQALLRDLDACVIWNDPAKSAGRYEVLSRLAADGSNRFRAFRADGDLPADIRYPVFIRDEHEHTGALSPLLADRSELDRSLAAFRTSSRSGRALLVVEFLNYASTDGFFRKYSVFRLGDRFIPKHVLFDSGWMLKQPDYDKLTAEMQAEERGYLASESGHGEVRGIFEKLSIDYGRIDYAVVQGRVQVFEINTNPIILKAEYFKAENRRRDVHRWFATRFANTLSAADPGGCPLAARLRWRINKPKFGLTPWWLRPLAKWA